MANPRGNPKNLRPWHPGQSGNPLGRSVARAELDNTFITALLDDFKMHGATAIEKCRQKHVAAYLGIIARTLPKELAVEVTRNDALQEMQHVHGLLERFQTLQAERNEAIEQLQRLGGSIEGRCVEG